MYPKNAASPQRVAVGPVVQISDGAVQTSGVSIKVVPQGGAASAGGGTTGYEEGIVHYIPTQAETNYSSFMVLAYKTGCIPASVTVVTSASDTAGYAGIDWSKVTAPTSTVGLSNTTVKTATDVETDTADIQSRLPAALVGGRIDANVGAISSDSTAADNLEAVLDGTGGVNLKAAKVEFTNGLLLTRSDSDSPAFVVTGIGTGAGALFTGGATGIGFDVLGGASGANGMRCRSGAAGGNGLEVTSQAGGSGLYASSNSVGYGITAIAGYGGITATGNGASGYGMLCTGSGGSGFVGLDITSGVGIAGSGPAAGMRLTGGTTGVGLDINGGGTSGTGMTIDSMTGDAVIITSSAGNGDAIQLTPHGTGYGINGTLSAVGAAGAGLTAVPWNASWDAEVQSEVADGLTAFGAATATDVTTAAANVSVDEIQATALADLFNTNSGTTYGAAVAGSVVKEIADNAGGASLTLGDIADAVWDEALAGHAGAGSAGEALAAAGTAGDPWTTALPGAYGAGTAGKIIGDNINATISSRASQSSVDTIDGIVDDILVDTAVIGAAGAGLTEAGGTGDHLTAVPWNAAWDAEVQSEVADGLTAFGAATESTLTTIGTYIDTEIAAILDDTGTSGVVISSATANKIADHVLRRSQATARASGDGDTVGFRSLLGATSKLTNKVGISGTDLETMEEDDVTVFGTQSITTDSGADPIVGLDTA